MASNLLWNCFDNSDFVSSSEDGSDDDDDVDTPDCIVEAAVTTL